MNHYKVMYHFGNDINIKTFAKSGQLTIALEKIVIAGKENTEIIFSDIINIETFRLHGLGTILKIHLPNNNFLFLSVIRFQFLGLFPVVNFWKTKQLKDVISKNI